MLVNAYTLSGHTMHKHFLLQLFLLFSPSFSFAQSDLIGYYSFCNCNANDNSGNNHHGILTGSPECIPGQRGEGFLFNQTPGANGCGQSGGEYVQLPPFGAIWANGFTVCAWVRFDNVSYYERIIDFGNGSGDSGGLPIWFGREGSSNNLTLESWISSNAGTNRSIGRLVAPNAITNGSIEYYCATISGDTMRIYVNGVLKAQKNGHPILNVPRSNNFLGRSNWCFADPDFKGFMDEVRIYNRALSESEINALYVETPTFSAYQSPVYGGDAVQLEAKGGIAYQWSPANSLNNPNIPNPIASPYETTTYTCQVTMSDGCLFTDSLKIEVLHLSCSSACTGTLGENIFPNGDFGSGVPNIVQIDPQIAPGYIYQLNPPPNDGFYVISNNTTTWGSFAANFWINIEDNGPEPNGYMMVVNASYQPGLFYQKTVDVCENTTYELSIDVISLIYSFVPGFIRPNISFLIDGNSVCETGNIAPDEQWHTHKFSFTTLPGQNSITLALRNNAPGGGGNDLAIDNISFRACGPTVEVPATVYFCQGTSVILNADILNSPYSNPVYKWQQFVNGDWQDIPNSDSTSITISNPIDSNLYRVVVGSALANLTMPNCHIVSAPVQILLLPDLIVETAVQDVACAGGSDAVATATSISGTAPFQYAWNSGANTSTQTNLEAGSYQVTVTDALGCIGVAEINVSEPPPTTVNVATLMVTCFGGNNASASAELIGGFAPFSYVWSNGQISANASNLPAGNYQVTVTDSNGCYGSGSFSITEPPPLMATASASMVSCFGGNDATATASVPGGIPPFSYVWSNGQTLPNATGLPAGIYLVTITDAIGCTAATSVNVLEPLLLTALTNTVPTSCYGGADAMATASVQGGVLPYQYLWSNGQTTENAINLSAGWHTFTATDANGCAVIGSGLVAQPSPLSILTNTMDVTCFGGEDGAANATISGGTAPYSITWSNGQTGVQTNNLLPGTYSLTTTDNNGCSWSDMVTVGQPPELLMSTNTSPVTCNGGMDGWAIASVSGGVGPYSFQWSNGLTSSQLNGLLVGNYSVTATDDHGCIQTGTIEINQPAALLAGTQVVAVSCFGGANGALSATLSGGVSPYTYQWSNGQTSATNPNLSSGVYSLTATDAHGCTITTQALVSEPLAITTNINSLESVSCHGGANGSVSVSVSGGTQPYTYLWNNGMNAAQINSLSQGEYIFSITDANGCLSTTSVLINEPEPLLIGSIITHTSCPGVDDGALSVLGMGGLAPYTYAWSSGQTTADIDGLGIGSYTVTVTDANLCTFSYSASLVEDLIPWVDLGDDLVIDLGDRIDLTAISNIPPEEIMDYTWFGSEALLPCADCFQIDFLPLGPGCESVMLRSYKGCIALDTVCFRVISRRKIYAPNVFSPNNDGSNDFFTIFSDASVRRIVNLSIYTRWGEMVYQAHDIQTNDEQRGWDGTYRGTLMNPAVFVWHAEVEFIDGERRFLSGDVTIVL